MKLHLTTASGNNLITGYGPGWVKINTDRHEASLVVLPDQLLLDWQVTELAQLTEQHFQRLAELRPEVVLLGTGTDHRFIHPRLSRALTDAGIGLECMDSAAACRTYNILMAEGRQVAAAIIL